MKPLFRAWYRPDENTPAGFIKFEQEIIDDSLYFVDRDSEWLQYPFEIPWLDSDNWILEQFINQVDSGGNKIFEGDIVRLTKPKRKVADLMDYTIAPAETLEVIITRDEDGYYGKENNKKYPYSYVKLWEYPIKEIIGNIHQNKDLLI